jgi:MYXO-CTERM domain-containing protein
MTSRLVLLLSLVSAAPVLAEAGLPNSFCGQQSCSCGTATCSCGQVCNLNLQRCDPAQSGFCSSDGDCAASCDAFICEGNVCTRGTRADAGTDGGMSDGGTAGTMSGPGCGCSSGAGALATGALMLMALSLKRRR